MKWGKAKWGGRPEMNSFAEKEMTYQQLEMTARLAGIVVKHLLKQVGGEATLDQAQLMEAEREWSMAIRLDPPEGGQVKSVHLRLVPASRVDSN